MEFEALAPSSSRWRRSRATSSDGKQADLKRAEDHFEDSQKHVEETKVLVEKIKETPRQTDPVRLMSGNDYAGRGPGIGESIRSWRTKFGIQKAKFTLEQAETNKEVLLKFIKEKTHQGAEEPRSEGSEGQKLSRSGAELELARSGRGAESKEMPRKSTPAS